MDGPYVDGAVLRSAYAVPHSPDGYDRFSSSRVRYRRRAGWPMFDARDTKNSPVTDDSWQMNKVYRGYRWGKSAYDRPTHHSWYADGRGPDGELIHRFSARFHYGPKQSWQEAHGYRQRRASIAKPYDYVPWEIHEIEDELAYHHALAGYLVSVDRYAHPSAETYDQIIDSLKIWL